MANFVFNIAKGRVAELVKRVDTNTPADAKLILVPLSASETEANAQDVDTLTAFLATAANEQTGGGWVRKTLTDADFSATDYDPDDANNYMTVSIPSVTWTTPTAGNNTTGLVICYNEEAAPTDANTIPLTHHDFAVTADGNNVVLNAGDFLRAS
jgi:hypothetical protein